MFSLIFLDSSFLPIQDSSSQFTEKATHLSIPWHCHLPMAVLVAQDLCKGVDIDVMPGAHAIHGIHGRYGHLALRTQAAMLTDSRESQSHPGR